MTTNKIEFIKLSNGDMIVAEVVKQDETTITLVDPGLVYYVPAQEEGRTTVAIAPYAPFSEPKEIPFAKKDIIFNVLANDELKNFYFQATGKTPAILTPNKTKLIIPS